jgi:putative ubiquitin-RnfH superfamily antitoxin RatB of RatAB toxin-antitoxin module
VNIRVQVVYALPQRQWIASLELADGATVGDALDADSVRRTMADAGSEPAGVGVWGRVVGTGHRLRDGDRVEIYRMLRADPKSARRQRARMRAARRDRL